ncbi:2-isopropylmalate synthase [Lentinula guzmanii]|uniref:2-isopropylmalate synthase n=1 Tax=Lentinula guzmanii TaxID=2804957 RepID=A0AA38J2G4_9AGAR|nr:2-isopropylmalate synthase [Lentinula guzmanii]
MFIEPAQKYNHYTPLNLSDRQWPSRVVMQHPTWLSTDLRDGNQAISKPMTITQKLVLFRLLVSRGFKEIEVAFPSASDTEFSFVRTLIENQEIPDDVWIQVIMPARRENILRTFEAIQGAKDVLVQLYSSTAPIFRDVIYRNSKDDVVHLAVKHTQLVRLTANEYTAQFGTEFQLVYGIEGFSQSEMDFVVEVCSEVKKAWESHGSRTRPFVFNLAATVECAPANHFADQVEYFQSLLPKRDESIISVHVHNDRGTAVAATEHAFQGISPGLDMSNLDGLVDFMTECNGIPVHPRHPYAGKLVYTAFSGGHQDGIRKGLNLMDDGSRSMKKDRTPCWRVPYLPVDPSDFGRTYEVRINSQSGKGGTAHVIEHVLGLDIPRAMQLELSQTIQALCNKCARELNEKEICIEFSRLFHFREPENSGSGTDTIHLESCQVQSNLPIIDANIMIGGEAIVGEPNLPSCSKLQVEHGKDFLLALNKQLGLGLVLLEEQSKKSRYGIACFTMQVGQHGNTWWGVGRAGHLAEATVRAIISAVNCVLDSKLDL